MKQLIALFVICTAAAFASASDSRSVKVSANTRDLDVTESSQAVPQATCWGQHPCCEWYEDENGDPTGRCRVFAVCFGGAWACP